MVTGQPFCEGAVDGSGTASHPGFHLAGFPAKLLPAVKVLSIRNHQYRRGIGYIAVHHVLGGVSEECRQGIELALGDGSNLWSWQVAHPTVRPRKPCRWYRLDPWHRRLRILQE